MKKIIVWIVVFLLFWGTACNAPLALTPTAVPPPSFTPYPTATVIPPTETPAQLTLRVTEQRVNCRYGPGVVYAFVNELEQGQFARVVGRNEQSTWWYVRDPGNPNGKCWVAANVTSLTGGDASRLPVVAPPPVSVTKIRLRIQPGRVFVPCSQFPQTIFFEAELTANGPAIAVWVLTSSAGYVSAENEIVFEEAGSKTINGYHTIFQAGDYWVQIQVTRPNSIAERINFPVNCAP